MTSLSLHDHLNRGHDNNLPLIRMVAALMVLVSHTFALVTGSADAEPWRLTYGHTPGTIAVEIFFLISGLLLTHSLTTRKSLSIFAMARIQRIYPGLIVAVLVSVALVSWLATPWSFRELISSLDLWRHIFHNASGGFLLRQDYPVPGAFASNPVPDVVNGSLWSLRREIECYAALAVVWGAAAWLKRPKLFAATALLLFGVLASVVVFGPMVGWAQKPYQVVVTRVFFMFAVGSVMCILGRHIKLSHGGALGAGALLLVGVVYPKLFTLFYTVTLPYLLFYIAFVPNGFIRRYNRFGDYSYGAYLYAFPLQQLVVALNPGITAGPMMAASFLLTMMAAGLSWHWVEKPAMAWRRKPSPSAAPLRAGPQAVKVADTKR
jgi:peptidoglycan/LPS O-acetylase OafA/YrhL